MFDDFCLHENLKAALIAAADAIIREKGIEAFSLREAARRATVSPGAPSHHFNGLKGLLTEVVRLGYGELAQYLEEGAGSGEPDARRIANEILPKTLAGLWGGTSLKASPE